jgi:hypothetical protein
LKSRLVKLGQLGKIVITSECNERGDPEIAALPLLGKSFVAFYAP